MILKIRLYGRIQLWAGLGRSGCEPVEYKSGACGL
jgi:hypothetical protein